MQAFAALCGVLAVAIAGVLLLAASRRLLLAGAALWRYRPAEASTQAPLIWIICACRNEARRMPRLIDSLRALRYRGRYRVVLIDDGSEDATPQLMLKAQADHPELIQAAPLGAGQLGKASALHAGLADAAIRDEDLMLVIDADHRLAPEALDNLANYFADPEVAAVAIEHPVDAPGRSVVSAYCFLEAAVREMVTSRGQHALGLPTKLAGSWACRPAAFRRHYPSGWQMADDTVFTAAIVADGGKVAYAADVSALQDVPDTIAGYFSQHVRWAAGYAESAARSIERRTGGGLLARLDAWATHAGYFERPLLMALLILGALGLMVGAPAAPVAAGVVVLGYGVVIALQIAAALWLSKAPPRLTLMSLAALPLLVVDIAVAIRGAMQGLAGRRVGWTTEHRG